MRVVTDKFGNVVTAFPSNAFKSTLYGLLGALLNPFDLISGELSADDMLHLPNYDKFKINCP